MEHSKLMTPLFYDGNFNREGRRMRAVLEKEISDGTQTYRLWRAAGNPDQSYPRTGNDRYILYVEINGYLAPLGLTEFSLTEICGFEPAAQKLYGGKEKRAAWLNALQESDGSEAVSAAMAEERSEIERPADGVYPKSVRGPFQRLPEIEGERRSVVPGFHRRTGDE